MRERREARAMPLGDGVVDAGHGFDLFGLHPAGVHRAARLCRIPYQHWFRVESQGGEHLPARGPAILAANHGGMLPIDGAMLWVDVLHKSGRVARPIADHFVPGLPFVGTLFARAGVVQGSAHNVEHLLARGGLVMLFPEGIAGMAKPPGQKYQLQAWRVGHAELALRSGVPVIPVGIVGPDEQWPELARLPLHLFGAPWLPVPLTPLPLPVRYHIRYGQPLALAAGRRP